MAEVSTEFLLSEAFVGDQNEAGSRRVVVMLFDGAQLGSMSFAFGVFDLASHFGDDPGLSVTVIAGEPDAAIVGGGLTCAVPYDLEATRDADLIIVPNLPQRSAEDPPELALEALSAAHLRGARVAGLCSGAFVLAGAGLLDDRPATTHWALADRLAEMYPKVRVDASALYIDDGDVLTAGGGAAGIDFGFHIIRDSLGAAAAGRLARAIVAAPHRAGGQSPYIETPIPDSDADEPVAESIEWARTRLDATLPVSMLAERANMSRRNYDRRFWETTGTTPARWLTHQRVIRAQQLLESTDLPIDEIARSCGFSSAATLRPHFRRLVGVTMTDYRSTFSHRLS